MTVHELKTLRHAAMALVCAAPVAALLVVPRPYWALLILGMLVLMLLMRYLLRLMLRRVDRLGNEMLDPDMLAKEAGELGRILSRPATQKNLNFIHLHGAMAHGLTGEYGKAVDDTMQIAFGQERLDASVKWDLAYYYLRDGKLSMAKALITQLMRSSPAQGGAARASQLRTLGLYHAEQGEYRQAAERLRESLDLGGSKLTRLDCEYDLARVAEAQGDAEQASAHYGAAAMLGPKTHLGREAAKKLVIAQSAASESGSDI